MSREPITFIYSGTISENYGVFDALKFVSDLNKTKTRARLTMVGFCSKKSTYKKIKRQIAGMDYVQLIGGREPVLHDLIIAEMNKADFALLPYRLDRSIIRCIPTKMYECIALRLPMVMRPNPPWMKLCNAYQACMPCKFDDTRPDFLDLLVHKKYYTKGDADRITWDNEATKLLRLMETITR
jgi:hypothetical protein